MAADLHDHDRDHDYQDHHDHDDHYNGDDSDEVVVKRRRRMRMYADDETPHQHASLR